MHMFTKLPLIATIILLLSSCGSWQHSYKDESTFYAENNACIAEANRVYPPLMDRYGSDRNNLSRAFYAENCMKAKGWRLVSN